MPETLRPIWEKRLSLPGVGGVAATSKFVVVSDRSSDDQQDVWRCFDAETGAERWVVRYSAKGELDYGNSPRATPLVRGEHVYLLGAFGQLQCVELSSGRVVWKKQLRKEFQADDRLVWGTASSPLIVDNRLFVNPGGRDASVVALDPANGNVVWKTAGSPPAFASFVFVDVGGRKQIIGYDKVSLGGWDVASGERLWTYKPPTSGDFNVPTPVVVPGTPVRLVITTETNGTRLFGFDDAGRLINEPVATNDQLAPDTHSPVLVNGRLFGVWNQLICLDLGKNLEPSWTFEAPVYSGYASIVANESRLLTLGVNGDLVLSDATSPEYRELGRTRPLGTEDGVYSHPAFVGTRMYLRGGTTLICLDLLAD